MRYIYESALTVLIWLGPEYEDSDIGMGLVEKVATRPFETQLGGRIVADDVPLPSCAVHALFQLMRREYWTQIWIAQEVAVASSDPQVGCGYRWLPWWQFGDALRYLYARLSSLDQEQDQGDLRPFVKDRHLKSLYFDLSGVRRTNQDKNRTYRTALLEVWDNRTWTNLFPLLEIGLWKGATDP
jgi:hypothetical protein